MATEKFSDGKSVKVESIDEIDKLNSLPESVSKSRNITKKVCLAICLFITLIFLFRIPYIGSFGDAYIFEFIFGNTKFIVYLWLTLFFTFKLFNFKFTKILWTRRFILGTILIILSSMIAFVIVCYLMNPDIRSSQNFGNNMSGYISLFTVWANDSATQTYHNFIPFYNFVSTTGFTMQGPDPGIIGVIIASAWIYVSYVLLGIVALIMLVSGILIYCNRTDNRGVTLIRRWLVHLLGGSFNSNTYDELRPQKHDVKPEIHQQVEIKQEASNLNQITPPISFLTDTGIDNYFASKKQAEKHQNTIYKFVKKLHIEMIYQKTIVMPLFSEIYFEIESRSATDEILRNQSDLLKELKVSNFNISFKGNVVRFEIPNNEPSKISMRSIFNSITDIKGYEAVVGMGYENIPLALDLQKHPNSMIIGRRGSGGAMLLTCLLSSLAYVNSPKNMEFIILSPIGDKSLKYFDALPHMRYPVINELDDVINKMRDLRDEIIDRQKKFDDAGASNVAEYNKYQSNSLTPMKHTTLVISSFDKVIKTSLQNVEMLSEILKSGPKVGVYTILLAINVNNETIEPSIYEQMNAKFVLRLESEHESLRMFDNYRGLQLYGNGDGYFFDDIARKNTRFQTCYLNTDELSETIKLIKTFYSAKSDKI